jgi:hypothetical protein
VELYHQAGSVLLETHTNISSDEKIDYSCFNALRIRDGLGFLRERTQDDNDHHGSDRYHYTTTAAHRLSGLYHFEGFTKLADGFLVIRVYDDAGNVIETREHQGDFREQ